MTTDQLTTNQKRATYAIVCAREVYTDPQWRTWADAWLDGSDRSTRSAEVVQLQAKIARLQSHVETQKTAAESARMAALTAEIAAMETETQEQAEYADTWATFAALAAVEWATLAADAASAPMDTTAIDRRSMAD